MKFLLVAASVAFTASAFAADIYVPAGFSTIQAAIDSPTTTAGDVIHVGPGNFAGATVNKAVTIQGEGLAVIVSGPAHDGGSLVDGFRLVDGSSGATISHLTFVSTVDLAIYSKFLNPTSGGADNVTITQCTFLNVNQAVTNWGGRAWEITHNTITNLRTMCGGGIGILIGDRYYRDGDGVADNVVSHNTISGQLTVPTDDCGDYNGSGIVIYSDIRYPGYLGGAAIAHNSIVKNKVSLTLNNLGTAVVDVVAFEITDTLNVLTVIHDNSISFNDFRGTATQTDYQPSGIDTVNAVSRNFGENRGLGSLHSSAH